ncbi:MAG: hypothetical protein UIM53_10245 [Acutalibacteraceae bacterium]|nr:hypothetical protein [Acutalibacteraceae bacterium]
MEQDVNLVNFTPNGYDTRYSGSFYNSNVLKIENNCKKIKNNILKTISVVSTDIIVEDNICETCEERAYNEIAFEQLISKVKSDFLAEFVIEKLSTEKSDNFPLKYISILESSFAEKEKLLPKDLFIILGRVVNVINSELSATERVVIFKEICKNSEYTYDEKIATLNIISENSELYSKECDKHIRNKIILLNIVKNSGFVMDFSEIREKERQKREYQKKFKNDIIEEAKDAEKEKLDKARDLITKTSEKIKTLTQKVEQKERKLKAVADVLTNKKSSSEDKLYSINNILSDLKQPGKDSITRIMVNSDEYFKFGAGITLSCDDLRITVPSGYIAETIVEKNETIIYYQGVSKIVKKNNFVTSPLVINIKKKKSDGINSLYQFFNKYIEFCRQADIKYNQTTISGLPAVFLRNDNKYMIFVYIHKQNMVIDIEIKFNITVLNKESIVKRIVSGIRIGGRV